MKTSYVCGYGRSGSTLLGLVLSARTGAMSLGELSSVSSAAFLETAQCACGRPFPTCSFWAAADDRLCALAPTATRLSHRRRRLGEGPAGLLLPSFALRRLATSAVFSDRYPGVSFAAGTRVLVEAAGGALVDISKTTRLTANRPRFLAAAGIDLELQLASRPLRSVIDSYRAAHGRRGDPTSGWSAVVKVAIGRAAATAAARWCARRLRVRLPRTTLTETTAQAAQGLDLEPTNHMIAGNRGRHDVARETTQR